MGRFVLAERVGRGAFAEVWRAHDPQYARDVAVKILDEDRAAQEEFRASLVREARALARLNGRPHVVDAYEYDVDGSPAYLVMEYAPDRTLYAELKHVRGRGGIGVARSVYVVDCVAIGLQAAHENNLVHLDVTPSNVRVGADGEVSLIDFGLVGAVDDEVLAGAVLRGEGIGTACYMAPERLGRSLVAPAFDFDVYALGCILFECLTGRHAFPPRRRRFLLERDARRRRRPRPSDVDPGLRAFDALVVDAIAVDPADRIPTVTAFRSRLHEVAG